MIIDDELIGRLLERAAASPRRRESCDLRDSSEEDSQRMLNALLPGTEVPIHRHPNSSESVFVLSGSLVELYYDDRGRETERIALNPALGCFGCQVPKGTWHSVEVVEPSVIVEVKAGRYGSDGSEQLEQSHGCGSVGRASASAGVSASDGSSDRGGKSASDVASRFGNSLGDLKKNVEYLIGMERHSGSMEVITPLYVSRMLNVSLEEVERVMKEMGM